MRITIDSHGRLTLPAPICKALRIKQGELELQVLSDGILLRKAIDGCIFCDTAAGLVKMGDYSVCEQCRKRLAEAKNGDYLHIYKID